MGSRKPLDRDLVSKAGLNFKTIFTGKLRRYFSWRNFVDPFFVILGFFQSLWILIRFWPQVVFSKGGFVSVPVVLAAFVLRRPIILHESDGAMGLANRISSRFAKTVCVAFPNVAPKHKNVILTGNPVRKEMLNGAPKKGYELTLFTPGKPVMLVWGGSLGAQEINELVETNFDSLIKHFQIIHVTGRNKESGIRNQKDYMHFDYLGDELPHVYAITDIVFGRAGANSLYELALVQKPNIVLPLTQNQDQMKNAQYFEQKGATIILRDKDKFLEVITALSENVALQKNMKVSLGEIARGDAASTIAELILKT